MRKDKWFVHVMRTSLIAIGALDLCKFAASRILGTDLCGLDRDMPKWWGIVILAVAGVIVGLLATKPEKKKP